MASLGSLVLQLAVNSGTFSRDLHRVARQTDREFSSIARNARQTASVLNKALTIGAGFGLTRLLRQVTEQTSKAGTAGADFGRRMDTVGASFRSLLAVRGGLPEVNSHLDQLAKTLQNPSVVAGADSFFSAILSGALRTATAIAEIVGGVRTLGVQFGLFSAKTQQEKIDRIDRQIGVLRPQADALADIARRRQLNDHEQRRLQQLDAQIAELGRRQAAIISAGPTAADAPPNIDAFRSGRGSAPFARSVNPQLRLELERSFDYLDDLKRRRDQFDKDMEQLEEVNLNRIHAMREVFKKSHDDMSEYARQAARNMQDAFANFLFDPFKDGVRGMLKGFIDAIRRMVAEAAAAKIFSSKSEGGLGVGSFITSLFGFQHGGQFKVGGSGGPDSQVVAFRATPGEHVAVTPPGKGAGGVSIVNQIHIDSRTDAGQVHALVAQGVRTAIVASEGRIRELVRHGRI